jgi:hypothetical protein
MAIKPRLATNKRLWPKAGHPGTNNKTGMESPLMRGISNHILFFMTIDRSKEINVPKNPPTINIPWLAAVPGTIIPRYPILTNPPATPMISANTIRGKR